MTLERSPFARAVRRICGALVYVALLALGAAARADGPDATMTVIDDDDTPDDIVKVIDLPGRAASAAGAQSGNASDTAAAAKEKDGSGRDFGQQVSQDARNNASDQAREAKARARNDARNDNPGSNRHGPPN